MSKKGFTLVELLATLVIIAIVMGIVLPSAIRVSEDNKDRMLEEYKKVVAEYALISPSKGRQSIDIDELDIPNKIKNDCTGHAELISLNPMQYQARILCNITSNS